MPAAGQPAFRAGRGRLGAALARPAAVIAIWAFVLAGLTGGVSNWIEGIYLEHYPYFYDPVAYYTHNARLHARVVEQGRWAAALEEWFQNPRLPLRTVPLILFAPQWLAERWGHLATALPMLGLLLFLLGLTLYRRTGHAVYSLACMLFYCGASGMLSPQLGVASYWLDLHASFLVGAAALCLLNSSGGRDLRWLAGFAACASGAALSRYVAGGYAVVMCAPVLAGYLLARWKRERSFVRAVLAPVGVVGATAGVLAGYYVVTQLKTNTDFYSLYSVALGHGLGQSAAWTLRALGAFVGSRSVVLLAGLCLVNLAWLARPLREWNWLEQSALVWLAVSHLLFVVFGLRLVDQWLTPLYGWALLYLLAVAPAPWRAEPFRPRVSASLALGSFSLSQRANLSRFKPALAAAMFAAAALIGSRNVWRYYREAQQPAAQAQAAKELHVALARAVVEQGDRLVWVTYFDTAAPLVTTEAYFRFGKLPVFPTRAGGQTLFNLDESIWAVDYPGLNPDEVSLAIYDKLCQWVDIVVTFEDPAAAEARFDNDYTRTLVRYVSQSLQSDPRWKTAFTIDSADYGRLVGYRNLSPQPGGYDWLIGRYNQSLP